jgi:hypothetical protein
MDRKLINVAIVNTFYEEKKNLLDTYYPFVLKAFNDRHICNLKDISDTVKSIFDFELPINSIKNILIKNSIVFQSNKKSKSEWEICLSDAGKNELNKLIDDEKKVEEKIEYFYLYFTDFSNKTLKTKYSTEDVKTLINKFILNNLLKISLDQISENNSVYENHSFEKHFIYFLAHINNNHPELVETFETLWKGSIIWNELKKESFEDSDIKLKKDLNIFIDTNFALSLLKLHNPIINQAAKELYDLIIGIPNIRLYILDVTLFEIFSLLDLYDLLKDNFTDIEVDSVFYYLKQQGFSSLKAERLKDNLEEDLKKLKIYKIDTEVLRETDQKTYANIYDYLYEKKNIKNENQPEKAKKLETAIEKSAHHDTSVILHVLKHKDRYSRNLEASKAIFLTSSYTLYKNFAKISRRFESFPCVILDTILTNILYLKNPQKTSKLSLTQIIKTHCNYLIIDQSIWNTYLSIINDLKKDEEISIEDYSRLITKNQITQEYLLSVNCEAINKHEVKSVLEKIKLKDQEKEKAINEKEAIISELTESNKNLISSIEIDREQQLRLKEENDKKHESEKSTFQNQLDSLKHESALKDYISEQLEKDFEPLSRKLTFFIFVCFLCILCYFLSDYIITDTFIKGHHLALCKAYLFRSLIVLMLLFLSGLALKIYNVNFIRFLVNRQKLKDDLKRKYIQEFEKN